MIVYGGEQISNNAYKKEINYIVQEIKNENSSVIALIIDRTPKSLYLMQALVDYAIAFIPIDPSSPQERVQFILLDSGVKTIVTQVKYSKLFYANKIIFIDEINQELSINKCNDIKESDIVYILYTSGSTGQPKGVKVTREAFFNFYEGISEIVDFSAGKRIACLTTISFDIFFLESLMALYKGLTVILANEDEQRNPKLMAKLIEDNLVDMIQITPSRMQLLINHDKNVNFLKNIKEILIGGEPFPLGLLRTLQENTTAKIYNMYGPTETRFGQPSAI